MGDKAGKGGSDSYAPNLEPLIQQQAGQSQAIFGATSPLLGGISAQYMNLLGIPYGGTGGAVGGAGGGYTPGHWDFSQGLGSQQYVPGSGGVGGKAGNVSLLPSDPGTGIADLSNGVRVRPKAVRVLSDKLDNTTDIPELAAPDAAAQLFNSDRALGYADMFTALPDNVSQFGAAKALAETQFQRARDEALAGIGGAGGSGAINASIAQLAGDRALGMSQVFAQLAANEAAARNAGFDRAIGIESGNVGREQQTNLFNTGNDFAAAQQLAQMQYGSDQANLDRALTTLQNRVNTQNQMNQNNIDRAIGIATGGTQLGLQGLGSAGNLAYNQGALAQQQYNANQQKKGDTGQAVGNVVAMKAGG